MNDILINRSPETWRLLFQKIQPTVAAGNAAYEAAVYASQGNRMSFSIVVQAYYDYLLRAGLVLDKEQLGCCVAWALELTVSLDRVLDHPALPYVLDHPEALHVLLLPTNQDQRRPILTKQAIQRMYADKLSVELAFQNETAPPQQIKFVRLDTLP